MTGVATTDAEAAKKITDQTGVLITWREILNRDMPKGVQQTDSLDSSNPGEDGSGKKPGGKASR